MTTEYFSAGLRGSSEFPSPWWCESIPALPCQGQAAFPTWGGGELHVFCHVLSETGRMWAQPWHSLSGDCARPDSVSPGVRVIAGHIFLLHVNPKCCACKIWCDRTFPGCLGFLLGIDLFLENSVLGCGLIYKLFNNMNNLEENTEYSWKSILIYVVASWSCSGFCSELTVSIHSKVFP